jgi:CubicO group peptidase (beta-lactamase class C family)
MPSYFAKLRAVKSGWQPVVAALLGVLCLLQGEGQLPASWQAVRQHGDFAAKLTLLQFWLQQLQTQHQIPGLSVAVVRPGQPTWATGLGWADLETHTPATANTLYPIASLTKPLSAILLMQLVAAGKLDLDRPFADYDPNYASLCQQLRSAPFWLIRDYNCQATVRQHLTHTTQGNGLYQYNSYVFGQLTRVYQNITGQPLEQGILQTYIIPLGLHDTATSRSDPRNPPQLERLASPYRPAWRLLPVFAFNPLQVGRRTAPRPVTTAAGVVSSVHDLALIEQAFQAGKLLSPAGQAELFTPPAGQPYALGWFRQELGGQTVLWHYGYDVGGASGLWVRLPQQGVTLILLANSPEISSQYDLERGNVLRSPFAWAFFWLFGGGATVTAGS